MDETDDTGKTGFPAHVREIDGVEQSVAAHCAEVARLAGDNAAPLGLSQAGFLLGLLHDWGKACPEFRNYLRSATGVLDQDADDYIDAARMKGKIDHSTAAAQWLWEQGLAKGPQALPAAQALALCLASHHSGLIDCLSPEGRDQFSRRIGKPESETHLAAALANLPELVTEAQRRVLPALKELHGRLLEITTRYRSTGNTCLAAFDRGFLVRMLLGCLLDADRFDSAAFALPVLHDLRGGGAPNWEVLIARHEAHLADFSGEGRINRLRRRISDDCYARAEDEPGIFTLTVPTGGGKTHAGLRFALNHARKHGLKRIIHVIPYTSIIDQNAAAVRQALETGNDAGRIVLEHHSNLEPERGTWISKHVSETWDAPVIFTTMVQFLEAAFGGGTRGARRLPRLCDAVIVFDEAQTLPIRCVHLFCNAVNFLVRQGGSSVVLCTATQPLLTKVSAEKGRIDFPVEMVGDLNRLFQELERVEIIDHTSDNRTMTMPEIADLAQTECRDLGNCLVVVNTKKAATELYRTLAAERPGEIFHLSTDMCAVHRTEVLDRVKQRLTEGKPTLCISTQLIEAGVDIDFRAVIRFLAGLDSIAQAAGRCNRNGAANKGRVHIVTPEAESLSSLPDIARGKEHAARVLRDFAADPQSLGRSLLHPLAMERYFKYAFHDRRNEMAYPVDTGRGDTLLEILAENGLNGGNMPHPGMLRQSFMTAADAFRAIDAPTEGAIVPYGAGKDIIAELQAEITPEHRRALLRRAQRYSVSLFPNRKRILLEKGALRQIPTAELLVLDERHYSHEFGLSDDPIEPLSFLEA